jgi:hypothetical protein
MDNPTFTETCTYNEVVMLETLRRKGVSGLAKQSLKWCQDEQRGIVRDLYKQIEGLEEQVRLLRDGPDVDWSDPVAWKKYQYSGIERG